MRAIAFRGGLFASLWFLITGGDSTAWVVGVPAVILAALISSALNPVGPTLWRADAIVPFIWLFFKQALVGGLDVARRAVSANLPINPGLVYYTCKLPVGPARVLFINVTGLLPGTLCADDKCGVMTVHALNQDSRIHEELSALETAIAALYRE